MENLFCLLPGKSCPYEVRVGDHYNNKGNGKSELLTNDVCAFDAAGLQEGIVSTVVCERPLEGRYMTVHVVDPLCPFHLRHMMLCDITVDTA